MIRRELDRYRSRLLELRARLTPDLNRITETVLIDARAAGEHDRGVSETVEKELALEQDEETIRRQVMEALQRIDDGTFGTCRECGGPIDPARLDAVPFTPYCIQCERKVEARR
jgi:RNA polymerase-binding transcription factor DksA